MKYGLMASAAALLFLNSPLVFGHERRDFECVVDRSTGQPQVILFIANDTSFPAKSESGFNKTISLDGKPVKVRVEPFECPAYSYCRIASMDLEPNSNVKQCSDYVEVAPAIIFEGRARLIPESGLVALQFVNRQERKVPVSKLRLRFFDLTGELTMDSEASVAPFEILPNSVFKQEIIAPVGTPASSRFCALEIIN